MISFSIFTFYDSVGNLCRTENLYLSAHQARFVESWFVYYSVTHYRSQNSYGSIKRA